VTMFRAGGEQRGIPDLAGASTLLADVSEWNPDIADATYLRWSRAIVVRALYGDAHDDAAWYGGTRRAALHAGGARFVGCYQYLVAGQDGAAQARAFHQLVGAIQPGEVFIADFEEGAHALLTAWYNEMLTLYGDGIGPYLWTYTGLNFGEANGALPVQWLADYTSAEPTSPHKLWQFTDSYQVPGVGTCDCSVFHGSIDELAALAYQAPKGWTFPAPTGLHVVKQTRVGYTFAWDAVTGPSGQKPASYSAWTYNAADDVVNRQTVTGLAASEYGPAGTGLPAGTYRTNVWANDAPFSPPHATVQVSLPQLRQEGGHICPRQLRLCGGCFSHRGTVTAGRDPRRPQSRPSAIPARGLFVMPWR
jgi:Glycosyl hydrolases family 25